MERVKEFYKKLKKEVLKPLNKEFKELGLDYKFVLGEWEKEGVYKVLISFVKDKEEVKPIYEEIMKGILLNPEKEFLIIMEKKRTLIEKKGGYSTISILSHYSIGDIEEMEETKGIVPPFGLFLTTGVGLYIKTRFLDIISLAKDTKDLKRKTIKDLGTHLAQSSAIIKLFLKELQYKFYKNQKEKNKEVKLGLRDTEIFVETVKDLFLYMQVRYDDLFLEFLSENINLILDVDNKIKEQLKLLSIYPKSIRTLTQDIEGLKIEDLKADLKQEISIAKEKDEYL